MRIGPLLFFIAYSIFLSLGFPNCKKEMKQLQRRVRKLERRVALMEKRWKRRLDCPRGFVKNNRYCLLFVTETGGSMTWQQGRDLCRKENADYVTIGSGKKEKFIARYLKENYPYQKNLEMYTGLIVTDELMASTPFRHRINLHNNQTRPQTIRWVKTNKSIKTDSIFKYFPRAPFVSWSPKRILGSPTGPSNSDGKCSSFSCISVALPFSSKPNSLSWSYSCCESGNLGYICETKAK